ncbi:outer membrane protein [Novosphingobium aquiterrae]|uniref:Outer membrane protein n=1 Tax=Novosphingobium aquiterrae TaxID=624388 RepID=A0ABV6PGE5_9SPHN
MKKILASAAVLAVAFSSSAAFAQDAAAFEGVYVGVTAGGAQLDSTLTDGDEYFTYGAAQKSSGTLVYGATAGYNMAVGSNGILGLEADFSGSTGKNDIPDPDWESYLHQKVDWFSTVRARAGLATGNAMVYATGGVAFARNDNAAYYDAAGCGNNQYDVCVKETKTSLVFGGGVEYKLSEKLSMKAEYLHLDGATARYQIPTTTSSYENVVFKNNLNIARIGFNYNF